MRQQTRSTVRRSTARSSDGPRRPENALARLSSQPESADSGIFQDRAFQTGLRASAAVLLVIAVLYVLYITWAAVQALLVAAALATMLWPWVTRATSAKIGRWRMPRALAVALIYLATLGLFAGVTWATIGTLLPFLDSLLASYPQQTAFLRDLLEPFRRGDIAEGAARVVEGVANGGNGAQSTPEGEAALGQIDPGQLVLGVFGGVVNTVLILIFTFFLLLEGNRFAQWILLLLPRGKRPEARTLGLAIRDRASRWVLATIAYAALSASIITVGLFLIGIPTPWMFGILGGLLAVIPGIGPGLAITPALAIALGLSPWQAVAVAVFGVVVYAADATFIAPKIFGSMLRLPMFVVFLAIILGGELLGVWGAILALPIAAGIQLVLQDAMSRPAEKAAS